MWGWWNQSVRGGTEGTDVATEQETSISQLMTVGEAGGKTEVAFETKLIPQVSDRERTTPFIP
jgi:hypothetical protein